MITGEFIELACTDKSCAPPPVGTGGSKPSGAGSAASGSGALSKSSKSMIDTENRLAGAHLEREMSQSEIDDLDSVYTVQDYVSVYHTEINTSLRQGGEHDYRVKYMDIAFENHSVELTKPITVLRGFRWSPMRPFKVEVGSVMNDRGFMSTSISVRQAKDFMSSGFYNRSGKQVLMRITVPAGTKVLAGSIGEKELILNRGTSVMVTKVETRKSGRSLITVVHGEVVK